MLEHETAPSMMPTTRRASLGRADPGEEPGEHPPDLTEPQEYDLDPLRAGDRPAPDRASWNAAWMRRCASAARSPSTTTEMLSSLEPWAMATTLIPPAARAENTPAATPGVPAMPRPTTARVATP